MVFQTRRTFNKKICILDTELEDKFLLLSYRIIEMHSKSC